ncbi:MAG: NAD-dependent epimerase/dehydratase family protein [Pedosphaera sp.]|nr:NAD-dependent epimerase/dehydratase family protein [Pedosphaera sp.]
MQQADLPKVIVTGGAGFVGSHLVERLLSEGRAVVVVDDCSTGSLANLSNVRDHPALAVIATKVSEVPDLRGEISGAECVYHLAASVGVELVINKPVHTLATNFLETEKILAAASQEGVPLLLTSTSEVYGKSEREEFAESDDLLIGPPHLTRWGYACSKLMDEFMALAHARAEGLPVVVARLFNTVGPRQTGRYGMVLPRFIESAISNKPIRVFGDGAQTRCFCDVRDVVEALVRLQRCPQARGEVVNVGGNSEITIAELAQTVRRTLGSSSSIEFVPYNEAYGPGFEEMRRRRPSIEKLERLTGFRPTIPLEQIIRHIVGR